MPPPAPARHPAPAVVRFYLDEHLSARIAEIARALGLDVVSPHEVGRHRLSDQERPSHSAASARRASSTISSAVIGSIGASLRRAARSLMTSRARSATMTDGTVATRIPRFAAYCAPRRSLISN